MLNLNIKLNSFDFYGSTINFKDTIRVKITTIPDMQKQSYTFNVNKTNVSVASFDVNYDGNTQQILIVFQKIGHFSSDQVIASTAFRAEEFPKLFNKYNNTGTIKVNIYEPFQSVLKNNLYYKKINKRKVVGTMVAQFTLGGKSAHQKSQMNNDIIKNNNIYKNINAQKN